MAAKGIILYDYMTVNGGAEKLTQTLLDHLPRTDLCAAFVNRGAFPSLGSREGQVFDLKADSANLLWRILRVTPQQLADGTADRLVRKAIGGSNGSHRH